MAESTEDPTVEAAAPPKRRPFVEWLKEQRRGLTQSELTDALHEVVAAVQQHGKVGTLTLQITVRPATKNSYGAVTVSDKVTVKAPEGERDESLFFVDPASGDLIRNNPFQRDLFEGGQQ